MADIPADTPLKLLTFEGSVTEDIIVTSTDTVGVGGSAYVLCGELHKAGINTGRVALKVFPTLLSDTTKELLRRELDVCQKFKHHHLLPFLGTCTFGMHTILVSQYMANGNLGDYLARNPYADRRSFVQQVAKGVRFLHESQGYVHGDLKCQNILVADDRHAVLADFGLSTTIEKSDDEATTATAIRQRNSLRFAAPELLDEDFGEDVSDKTRPQHSGANEHGNPPASKTSSPGSVTSSKPRRKRGKTPSSDVYAFGMVVFEIFTGKLPWAGSRSDLGIIKCILRGDVQPKPDLHVYTERGFTTYYWDMCLDCWSLKPENRPPMKAILEKLQVAEDASALYGYGYCPPIRIKGLFSSAMTAISSGVGTLFSLGTSGTTGIPESFTTGGGNSKVVRYLSPYLRGRAAKHNHTREAGGQIIGPAVPRFYDGYDLERLDL